MTAFIVYDTTTGRVTSFGTCNSPIESMAAPAGRALKEVQTTYRAGDIYVLLPSGDIRNREPLSAILSKGTIAADQVDEAVLSGLPIPCRVVVDTTAYEVNDGSFELSAATPGEYTITIDEVEYIPRSWVVEAV